MNEQYSRQTKYRRTFRGYSMRVFHHQCQSSRTRGHDLPEYTKQELAEWLKVQPNFQQLWGDWILSDYEKLKRPSVDRLDDSKGYSFGNIQLTTWEENNHRGHLALRKIVLQIDKDGTIVAKHNSLNEAGKAIGTTAEMVGRVCRGQYGRKSHKGFIWKYE